MNEKTERPRGNKGRFEKAEVEHKPTGYEYKQELVSSDHLAFRRSSMAEKGWEPDPTWTELYTVRGLILVIYRRKKV